jgi:transcription initiation factor TFIIIB Brf1 subunit/transcription initiation factor TFIIB
MTTRPESKAQYVDITAACCVYAAARLHQQPLLLTEVASLLQQDVQSVFQQYLAVVQLLQLQVK